jgi:integrase
MKKSSALSKSTLSHVDNRKADGEDVRYLKQARGPGSGWIFRLPTPPHLMGVPNPWDGKLFLKTITRGLGTRHLPTARKHRDQLLGDVRRLEAALSEGEAFSLASAEEWREAVRAARQSAPDPANVGLEFVLLDKLERAAAGGISEAKLERFHRVATGKGFPLSRAHEQYVNARRPDNPHGFAPLKLTTVLNLATAVKHLRAFLEDDRNTACLEDVKPDDARRFRDEYLPGLKGRRSPEGLSAKTIEKNITLLRQMWVWARGAARLAPKTANPWVFPKGLRRNAIKTGRQRDDYTPEETSKLLKATERATRQGDVIRLAIATGCRVDEVASVRTAEVKPDGKGFRVVDGKTKNGNRFVPVVGDARTLLQARLAANGSNPSGFSPNGPSGPPQRRPQRSLSGSHGSAAALWGG